jgi:methanogenic corrinoid protein MtbC1
MGSTSISGGFERAQGFDPVRAKEATMGGLQQPQRSAGSFPRGDECTRATPPGAGVDRGESCRSERDHEVRLLYRTVENEIIPRLMLLHRSDGVRRGVYGTREIGAEDVVALTRHVIDSYDQASAFVEGLIGDGAELEAIYLQLLAGVAARLGDLWNADEVGFAEVTIGLSRLQRMLHVLSESDGSIKSSAAIPGHALFVAVPGEQHTFGLNMVGEFFRASGWDVYGEPPTSDEALVELARVRWFDVIGFSIGNDRRIELLAALIRAIRKTSRNRSLRVMVGGPLLLARPQVVALVGADATAPDARQAMLAAERLMAMRDEGR